MKAPDWNYLGDEGVGERQGVGWWLDSKFSFIFIAQGHIKSISDDVILYVHRKIMRYFNLTPQCLACLSTVSGFKIQPYKISGYFLHFSCYLKVLQS